MKNVVVKQMQTIVAASPRESNNNNHNASDKDLTSCNYCVGVSVYTREMLNQRLPPRCNGLEIEVAVPRDRVDALKNRAAKPRTDDDFTFLGIGLSIYSRAWMYEATHLPLVKGLGVVAIEKDEDDVMAAIEERKRIRRELARERRRRHQGDVVDGSDVLGDDDVDDRDDDLDIVDDFFGHDDGNSDAAGLVEKTPLGGVGKPRLPPVLPVFTVEDLVGKSVDSASYAANAMYSFWAKRLDGFGERYVESCTRLVAQMEIQATRVPQNCVWLVRQIERTLKGGRGSDDDSKGHM